MRNVSGRRRWSLRRCAQAGAGFHRTARRSVGPTAGRTRHRRAERRGADPPIRQSRRAAESGTLCQAEDLELYRSIATMEAPLPKIAAQTPTWHKAAALARKLQLNQLAGRLEEMAMKPPPGPRSPKT